MQSNEPSPELWASKLLERSARDPDTGCLRWTGPHVPDGYGYICVRGVRQSVHRAAYKVWIGPIPAGLQIDHVYDWGCRHRDCFEPTHLEAVTQVENIRRAFSKPGMPPTRLFGRDACPRGHELLPENIWTRKNGDIVCRACHEEANSRAAACEVCGKTISTRNLSKHRRVVHNLAPSFASKTNATETQED